MIELIFGVSHYLFYNKNSNIAVGCILFELITRTPMFPGDSEGLQVLEHTCIIGSPSDAEMGELAKIIE